jgi:hypothetical protein
MAAPILLEGTVKKRGDGWGAGGLKARHFVLQGNRMEYFVAAGGKKQGEVLLGPRSAVGPVGPRGFKVQSYSGARVFECETDTTAERDQWVAAIFAIIEGRPVPTTGPRGGWVGGWVGGHAPTLPCHPVVCDPPPPHPSRPVSFLLCVPC